MQGVRLWCITVFLMALAAPVALWGHVVVAMGHDFRLDAGYLLTGWSGYGLIALGLLLLLPVVISVGMNPDSRLYPRSRNAFLGWGTTLYLLGTALASIVGSAVGT
jgi:hypothetical protein